MDNSDNDLEETAKDWDKKEIVYTKAKIFDLIKSRELLQFSINKINQDITKLLKKLEDTEKPVAKPDKEGE